MRSRGKSIRRKIVALLLVPLVSLVALWIYTSVDAATDVSAVMDVSKVHKTYGLRLDTLLQAMQTERRNALLYLAEPEQSHAIDALDTSQDQTDKARDAMLAAIKDPGDRGLLTDDELKPLDQFGRALGGLGTLRERISSRNATRADAYAGYFAIVEKGYVFQGELITLSTDQLAEHARSLVLLARAEDAGSRADALASAALVSGRMSDQEFRDLSDAVSEERMLFRLYQAEAQDTDRAAYRHFAGGKDWQSLREMEDGLVSAGSSGAPRAVAPQRWHTATTTVHSDLHNLELASAGRLARQSKPHETHIKIYAAIVIGLGLIAVVASVIISVRVGRGLVRDLRRLRKAALELSGNRLPRVMRRLASGEEVNVDAEIPPIEFHDGSDEISQVGEAFNDVQRAAVEAAVRQADMRRGVSEVFVNLARRSQVLLHRQLTLLDQMERRTEDSEELADLFRLDHMTTRMRRHAEGLVILSGAAPARAWRKPVMLINVVRAAVAEVEDYERVEVRRLPRVAVAGAAIADVTHLIAELVENATVFSPPHTQVHIHGERVANGFVLEVDDRGLGMSPEALLEANQRLAETPEFELSDTDRLGLFVVSRLAQRHSVRVSLRQSPYGGTTAVVLLPNSILTDPASGAGRPDGAAHSDGVAEFDDSEFTSGRPRTEAAFRQWGLGPVPDAGGDQHQQTADPRQPQPTDLTAGGLPRRRRSPVLVADRGRTLSTGAHAAPGEPAPAYGQARGGAGQEYPPVRPAGPRAAGSGAPAGFPPPSSPPAAGAPAGATPAGGTMAGGYPPTGVPSGGAQPGGFPGSGSGGPGGSGSGAPTGARPTGQSGDFGLPRRVRQASLAPQLRSGRQDGGGPATGQGGQPPVRERSADEVRSRMASFQRGWQRGRSVPDGFGPDGGESTGPQGRPDGADGTRGTGGQDAEAIRTSTERDGR
jgi:signal transduction histidine kinase